MVVHPEPIRLNIGAGKVHLDGWLSVGLDKRHDIRSDIRRLPLPDRYADEAMAIHVIEHVNRWEVPDMLRDWRRVLKSGARLTIEMPELRRCCAAILDGKEPRAGLWGMFGDPNSRDELMMHRWCWTEEELMHELRAAGFRDVHTGKLRFHGKKKLRDMHIEAVR